MKTAGFALLVIAGCVHRHDVSLAAEPQSSKHRVTAGPAEVVAIQWR